MLKQFRIRDYIGFFFLFLIPFTLQLIKFEYSAFARVLTTSIILSLIFGSVTNLIFRVKKSI